MPIYDFKCSSCAEVTEHILLGFSADPPSECPECKKGPMVRVYSGANVHVDLNSWGFSKTDGLVGGDTSKKDFKALKERAQRIVEE